MGITIEKTGVAQINLSVYSSGALVETTSKVDFRGSVDVSNNASSGTVIINISGGGGGTDATKYAQSGETRNLVTSGGAIIEGAISGRSLVLTSGLVSDGVTANVLSGQSLTLTSGLISDGLNTNILSGKSLNLTSGLVADGLAVSILSGKSLTLTSGLVSDGVVANIISGKSLVLTSGIIADVISGAVVNATSGFVGNAQSGYVLTSVASGSLAVWSAPAGGSDATKYAQSGETRNLVTSGGIYTMGGYISGTINAGLINAGSLGIAYAPQGSTSGQVLMAQGAGNAPAYGTLSLSWSGVVTTLTWTSGAASGTWITPNTDTAIDVSEADTIAVQGDSTDAGNTTTSIDLNIIASPDGTNYDSSGKSYAEINFGDNEVVSFLVSPGPKNIKARLDNNTANNANVTARVYVRVKK